MTTTPATDDVVRIPIGKGCYLCLTWREYKRGIARGKAERRRAALTKRFDTAPEGGNPRGDF